MPLTRLPLTTGVSGTLAVGNGGTNVTTSAAVENLGKKVLIKEIDVSSAVASVDFVNGSSDVVFDSTYNNYQLIVSDILGSATDTGHFKFRVSTDTGSTYKTTGYLTSNFRVFSGPANSTSQTTNTDCIQMLALNIENAYGKGTQSFKVDLFSPSITSQKPYIRYLNTGYDNNTYSITAFGGGVYNTAGAYDAFRIIANTGNITDGSFKLYGIRD